VAVILAQVVFEADTLLPEDRFVNTFHFNGVASDAVATDIASWLIDFYNTNGTSGKSIADFMSPFIDSGVGVSRIKFYDVTSGPAGTPYHEIAWTLGPPDSAVALPNEVAMVLSFKSAPLAGAQEARRRGRVYLGPLNGSANSSVSAQSRPDDGLRTAALEAAQRLHDGAEISAAPWVIFSRVNDSTSLVDIAWVDNAFDTQRRRGLAASSRTTVTL
jgi:hypothetical protein